MQKRQRERNINFFQEEMNLLNSLAKVKKHIIEFKKSDGADWHDTEKKWKNIAEAFKASPGSVLTPAEQKVKDFDSNVVLPCTSTSGSIKTLLPAKDKNVQLSTEQTLSDDPSNSFIEISKQDIESPRKKVYEVSKSGEEMQCKPKEERPLDKLIEEKIEITKIQKKIITEELEQKLIQRKILEKELKHKNFMYELEKQHLHLKMELLKKDLRDK